jgi:hypothetical protein
MHCHNTIQGLNDWTHAMFEKFGWMILASIHDQKKTITGYIESLTYLHSCIKQKIVQVESIDSKHDLTELCNNIEILIHFAKTCLVAPMSSKKKKLSH